jgi:hypothetical protein
MYEYRWLQDLMKWILTMGTLHCASSYKIIYLQHLNQMQSYLLTLNFNTRGHMRGQLTPTAVFILGTQHIRPGRPDIFKLKKEEDMWTDLKQEGPVSRYHLQGNKCWKEKTAVRRTRSETFVHSLIQIVSDAQDDTRVEQSMKYTT